VYVAGLIALTHAWLEAPSKRVAAYNVLVGPEVILYAVLWLALLTARLPAVRGALRRLVAHR
jgi:DMSO/TMAO reductase YedYZ heme-binding membrane subunit